MTLTCGRCILLALVLVLISGCGDSKPTESSTSAAVHASQSAELENVSPTLRQELYDLTLDVFQKADPNMTDEEVRNRVEQMIVELRKSDPDIFKVSPQVEAKLEKGLPIVGVARRIADAERTLRQSNRPLPSLAAFLYQDYRAGRLSPARTELLAQTMEAAVKVPKR